jgi:hypothetical protein
MDFPQIVHCSSFQSRSVVFLHHLKGKTEGFVCIAMRKMKKTPQKTLYGSGMNKILVFNHAQELHFAKAAMCPLFLCGFARLRNEADFAKKRR